MPELQQLQTEAEDAIGAAGSAAELEDLRVRYLGRKSQLTSTLRVDRRAAPEQRGPVGKQANRGAPGAGGPARAPHGRARGVRAGRAPGPGPIGRDAARRPAPAGRSPASCLPDPAADGGCVRGSRVLGARRPGDRIRVLQLHRAQPSARRTRRGCSQDTSTSPRKCCCAPTPRRCGCGRWRSRAADLRRRCRAASTGRRPRRHRMCRCSTSSRASAIDEDITLADLQGVLLPSRGEMFGEATEVRLRPGYFPSPSRAWRWTSSCFRCNGHRLEGSSAGGTCEGGGVDRDPRLRDGRSERAR